MTSTIAATVVLYQPDESILKNINSYLHGVDRLYVVDNSVTYDDALINQIKALGTKVTYLNNEGNQGVGHALNRAANEAITAGYQWLLTMDQDSRFDDFAHYLRCASLHIPQEQVAIFAPNISDEASNSDCSAQEREIVITSGNLVNLRYMDQIGGYEAKLFIDEIDHDFCLKVLTLELKIVLFDHIHLIHAIGDKKEHTSLILRKKKHMSYHSYQRFYYQTRNRLYMAKKHGKTFPQYFALSKVLYKVIYKKGFRVIQWEQDKLRKLKAIYHGVRDYLHNSYGAYNVNKD